MPGNGAAASGLAHSGFPLLRDGQWGPSLQVPPLLPVDLGLAFVAPLVKAVTASREIAQQSACTRTDSAPGTSWFPKLCQKKTQVQSPAEPCVAPK